MQQTKAGIPAVLDAATVLELHRLTRPCGSPPGMIEDALMAGRFDVLEILYAAGQFDQAVATSASYTLVFKHRNAQALDWLISKGLEPGRARFPGTPAWFGLDAKSGDGLWQEGLIRLLEAGVLEVDHRIGLDFAKPPSLLEFAVRDGADLFACELLERGAAAGVQELQMALRSGCAGAVSLIAARIPSLTRFDLRKLRDEIVQFNGFGMAPADDVRAHKTRAMTGALNSLATRALEAPALDKGAYEANNYVEELQLLDVRQMRAVVSRYPQALDGLLHAACRIDAVTVAPVLLEAGARLDASEGGRRAVSPPRNLAEKLYSPHALHNAVSVSMMRLLLARGADLHAKWNGWGVLHWTFENFRGPSRANETVAEAKAVLDFLAQQGVDFAEGANGRSVKQLAVSLCEDLKRHLTSIRTGSRISSAMPGEVDEPATPDAEQGGPGVL